MPQQTLSERTFTLARIDLAPKHRQPSTVSLVAATVLSVAGSLIVDALIVAIGTRILPSTKGYVHFRFSDYATLTVVGVLTACAAWPAVTRITSAPRWMFFRMAIAVTLVLWLPDIWLLTRSQPPKAVAILMTMHLAIALVTYNVLTRVARVGPSEPRTGPGT